MLKILLKYKWYIVIILGLIIIEPTINSYLNFWLQEMFTTAKPGTEIISLLRLVTIGFLLWLIKRLVSYISALLKSRYICNAKQDIKHHMFVNLLESDLANLSSVASSGEYISLFTNDINLIESRFLNQIVSLTSNIFSIAILGTTFFMLNDKLAVAIIFFGTIAMFVPIASLKILNKKNDAYLQCVSKFTQHVKESVIAFPTIKNYAIEQNIAERFSQINQETENTKFEADYALNVANSVGQLMSWFMQFIAVGVGLVLVSKGEIPIGTVIAAQSFSSDLALPLQNVIMNINSIFSTRKMIRKIETLSIPLPRNCETKTECLATSIPTSKDNYAIIFDNLCLTINGKQIIDHFSFNFKTGNKYLIVGTNGAGKSSIFRALKRWFREYEGKIIINGNELSAIDGQKLSQEISYLNEKVSMFSGTVKDNILLDRSSSLEKFERTIRAAKIKLDAERLVADEGSNISSGEQRRIEIARSLLESAKILIFDEVVSTLDIETAYEIEKQALGLDNKTIIFISHNFSGKLIQEYDDILVIDRGRLLAHGTYSQLLEKCEYFRKICEIKFGEI